MLTRRRHYLFVLAVWAIYSHAVAQSPPSGTDNTKVGVELTAVVVTATKRDVRSQDVPLAVTPLSEQALRNLSATGLEDYYRSVPSMSVTDLGTGTQRVAIRGINPTSGVTSVKLYFGETPLPETRGNYGGEVLNLL
ncbi:MAG: TonB-dependent receptor plug domain-containing protein [Steroidobacteraceae bacterium]